MPGMTGFDLLKLLPRQPLVVFTTAYDQYALKAFQENSVDYLLKPVEPAHLERALAKIRQWRSGGGTELPFAMQQAIARLAAAIPAAAPA